MASNYETECEFVEKPSEEYLCPVTFELLKDPRQTNSCCGKHLSGAAAKQLEARGQPCPLCKSAPLKTTKDLFFKRKVMELKVYCSYKSAGCEWKGELGELERHFNLDPNLEPVEGQCDFVEVQCSLECGKTIQRRHLQDHQSNECENRPFSCKYCDFKSTYGEVVNDHLLTCQCYPEVCPNKCSDDVMERRRLKRHLDEECKMQEIECKFSHAGCPSKIKRQDMRDHMEIKKDEHLEMVSTQCKKLKTEVTDLKFAISQIAPRPVFFPPPEIIYNFEKRDKYRFSPSFYTHVGGYKMCLGIETNKGPYVGVYIHMMKGEFDSHLQWPFEGEIIVQLVNQKEGGRNYEKQVVVRQKKYGVGVSFDRVTEEDIGTKRKGLENFISHDDLYKPQEGKEYLKNDTLMFKVTKVVVSSVHAAQYSFFR